MIKNKIDKTDQELIRGYMELLKSKGKNKKKYEEQFLSIIPENLKKNVLMSLNGGYLITSKVLGSNFSERFLREISASMIETIVCPGETIYDVIWK